MSAIKPLQKLKILLADDDPDDCQFFKEALDELQLSTEFSIVHNGEELIRLLFSIPKLLPDLVFIDLNMPRKNGLECLLEIKRNVHTAHLPVIILSTSSNADTINLLYKNGAQNFIRKPNQFSQLKDLLSSAIKLMEENSAVQPVRENFVLSPENLLQ